MADVGRSDDVEQHLSDPRPVERENLLAKLAQRQYGVVARDQMLGLGFTAAAIRYRLECNRLREVHPAVYAVGAQPLIGRGRWFAALLATRPSPVLSHLSSAAAQELARERGPVHVTVVRRSARRLSGVVVHRVRRLDPADIMRIDGLPLTRLPRTLLDIAETEPFDQLKSIAEAADRRELLDLVAIRDCMNRNPGRRGLAVLDRVLDGYLPVDRANEGLERHFQEFVAERGFPTPQCNVLVDGLLVDFWWPQANLVVELDSKGFHADWAAAERDRERDAKLMRLDIHTLRVTDRRLRRDRNGLAGDIEARFANAGAPLELIRIK
jgi:hypothetical protein